LAPENPQRKPPEKHLHKFAHTTRLELLKRLEIPDGLWKVSPVPLLPLSWSRYVRLPSIKNDNARQFYEDEALRGCWSVRQLDRQTATLFYERAKRFY
jgi:hypothetical protein